MDSKTNKSASESKEFRLQIMLDSSKILDRILTTFVEFMIARGVIPKDSFEKSLNELQQSGTDDLVFKIKIFPDISAEDNKTGKLYVLKIITQPQKITAISKDSDILDFLKKYDKYKKFIVVKDIVLKVYNQITSKSDTEIFKEQEIIYNILNHVLQPKYEIMTDDEVKKFFVEYMCKPSQVSKLPLSDPVAKAYGLKVGQMLRIIRPSEAVSEVVTYRIACPAVVLKN